MMKRMDYVELDADMFRFAYKRTTTDSFPGYYHYHRSVEFFYVHEGSGHVLLEQRLFEFQAPMLFCYKPFQLHRVHADATPETPLVRTIILFEPAIYEPYLQPYPKLAQWMRQFLHRDDGLLAHAFSPEPALLTALLDHYAERLEAAYEHERRHTFGLFLTQFLDLTLPYWQWGDPSAAAKSRTRNARYSERIMEWIEQRYTEPFELDALAADLHLSKHYVSRVFQQETGSSITDYLVNRRIREACRLLASTDRPVQEIGAAVGIPSFAHFCHMFKKTIGRTPQKFRNAAREQEPGSL